MSQTKLQQILWVQNLPFHFFAFFRCHEVSTRKEYVKLVEDVRDAGGEVKIFSSMHISGQRKCYFFHIFHNLQSLDKQKSAILLKNTHFSYRTRTIKWDSSDPTIPDARTRRRRRGSRSK